jgi:hydrogenase maturation protease
MGKTLILGIGNLLLSDDGVGVHFVQRLEATRKLPGDVQVVDGGTAGLDLLYYLQDISKLIVVDAMQTGGPPGSFRRLTGDQVPAYMALKMSPHEIALPDMLAAAHLRGLYPPEVVIWGVQPGSLELGVELSPEVAARLDELVEKVVGEI